MRNALLQILTRRDWRYGQEQFFKVDGGIVTDSVVVPLPSL